MKPLVSVITVTYQDFRFIFDTLDSILKQDYPRIQLIIMDDGSEDFPNESIIHYIYERRSDNIESYHVEQQSANVGIVKNANSALKMAAGQYIVPLSCGDCFYEKNTVSQIIQYFEDTGVDLVSCRRLRCTESELRPIRYMPPDEYIPKIAALDTAEKQFKAFATGMFYEMASGSSTYYRKDFLERRGCFDEAYTLWEDGPLYIQYTRSGNMIPTNFGITSIKYREGGISTTKNRASKTAEKLQEDALIFIRKEIIPFKERFSRWQLHGIKYSYAIGEARLEGKSLYKVRARYPALLAYKCFVKLKVYLLKRKGNLGNEIQHK